MELTKRQYYGMDLIFNPASIMQGEKDLSDTHNIIMAVEIKLHEWTEEQKEALRSMNAGIDIEFIDPKKSNTVRQCGACGAEFTGLFKDHVCKEKTITRVKSKNEIINILKRDGYTHYQTFKEWVHDSKDYRFLDKMFEYCGQEIKLDSREGRHGYYWDPEWIETVNAGI